MAPSSSLLVPSPLAGLATAKSRELRGHKAKVLTVDWSIDGKRLASGSSDHTARIYTSIERTTRLDAMELRGHTSSVFQLCWDPQDAERLATGSTDHTVRLWDVRTGKTSASITLSGESLNLSWRPDGATIAVGSDKNVISFVDVRKMAVEKTKAMPCDVNEMGWTKTGDLFFVTTGLGTVSVMSAATLEDVYTVQAHTANCYCLDFDPTGRYFAVGGADALMSLWDLREFACIRTMNRLEWPVRALGFSYDGTVLAAASEDLVIDLSNVETGELIHQIPTQAATNSVAWHPSQYLLAFAGDEVDRNRKADEGNLRVFGFASD